MCIHLGWYFVSIYGYLFGFFFLTLRLPYLEILSPSLLVITYVRSGFWTIISTFTLFLQWEEVPFQLELIGRPHPPCCSCKGECVRRTHCSKKIVFNLQHSLIKMLEMDGNEVISCGEDLPTSAAERPLIQWLSSQSTLLGPYGN